MRSPVGFKRSAGPCPRSSRYGRRIRCLRKPTLAAADYSGDGFLIAPNETSHDHRPTVVPVMPACSQSVSLATQNSRMRSGMLSPGAASAVGFAGRLIMSATRGLRGSAPPRVIQDRQAKHKGPAPGSCGPGPEADAVHNGVTRRDARFACRVGAENCPCMTIDHAETAGQPRKIITASGTRKRTNTRFRNQATAATVRHIAGKAAHRPDSRAMQ